MSRLGTFRDLTITENTSLDLTGCGDVFIENIGGKKVFFSKKEIISGTSHRPADTAIFDGPIEITFNDVLNGSKQAYISYFKYYKSKD